jgi:hypothetical protein
VETPSGRIERLRALCLSFPGAQEKLSHGSPTWYTRRTFATLADHHHGDHRLAFWCPAPPGVQQEMVDEDPERFFRPPYVGPSGWLGVSLEESADSPLDWDEIHAILTEAYRLTALKRLIAQLDA